MTSNIDKYKNDLDTLVQLGDQLMLSMEVECNRSEFEKALKTMAKEKADKIRARLKPFKAEYQRWYSEAKALVRQIIPDRLDDFTALYEKPKSRKEITYSNYVIHDYLQGIQRTIGDRLLVGTDAAVPQFQQQLNILKSAKAKFESSLFDIKHLVLADLLDSELDVARELNKQGFARAGGAVAGVALEKHLLQVTTDHGMTVRKNPTIATLNDALKANGTIDTAQWRFIQHLGDIRNACDHGKQKDPTKEQVGDLIDGVAKVIKTIF